GHAVLPRLLEDAEDDGGGAVDAGDAFTRPGLEVDIGDLAQADREGPRQAEEAEGVAAGLAQAYRLIAQVVEAFDPVARFHLVADVAGRERTGGNDGVLQGERLLEDDRRHPVAGESLRVVADGDLGVLSPEDVDGGHSRDPLQP